MSKRRPYAESLTPVDLACISQARTNKVTVPEVILKSREIRSTAKMVFGALFRTGNFFDSGCTFSNRFFTEKLALTESAILKHLSRLSSLGFLLRVYLIKGDRSVKRIMVPLSPRAVQTVQALRAKHGEALSLCHFTHRAADVQAGAEKFAGRFEELFGSSANEIRSLALLKPIEHFFVHPLEEQGGGPGKNSATKGSSSKEEPTLISRTGGAGESDPFSFFDSAFLPAPVASANSTQTPEVADLAGADAPARVNEETTPADFGAPAVLHDQVDADVRPPESVLAAAVAPAVPQADGLDLPGEAKTNPFFVDGEERLFREGLVHGDRTVEPLPAVELPADSQPQYRKAAKEMPEVMRALFGLLGADKLATLARQDRLAIRRIRRHYRAGILNAASVQAMVNLHAALGDPRTDFLIEFDRYCAETGRTVSNNLRRLRHAFYRTYRRIDAPADGGVRRGSGDYLNDTYGVSQDLDRLFVYFNEFTAGQVFETLDARIHNPNGMACLMDYFASQASFRAGFDPGDKFREAFSAWLVRNPESANFLIYNPTHADAVFSATGISRDDLKKALHAERMTALGAWYWYSNYVSPLVDLFVHHPETAGLPMPYAFSDLVACGEGFKFERDDVFEVRDYVECEAEKACQQEVSFRRFRDVEYVAADLPFRSVPTYQQLSRSEEFDRELRKIVAHQRINETTREQLQSQRAAEKIWETFRKNPGNFSGSIYDALRDAANQSGMASYVQIPRNLIPVY